MNLVKFDLLNLIAVLWALSGKMAATGDVIACWGVLLLCQTVLLGYVTYCHASLLVLLGLVMLLCKS